MLSYLFIVASSLGSGKNSLYDPFHSKRGVGTLHTLYIARERSRQENYREQSARLLLVPAGLNIYTLSRIYILPIN